MVVIKNVVPNISNIHERSLEQLFQLDFNDLALKRLYKTERKFAMWLLSHHYTNIVVSTIFDVSTVTVYNVRFQFDQYAFDTKGKNGDINKVKEKYMDILNNNESKFPYI